MCFILDVIVYSGLCFSTYSVGWGEWEPERFFPYLVSFVVYDVLLLLDSLFLRTFYFRENVLLVCESLLFCERLLCMNAFIVLRTFIVCEHVYCL